MIIAPCQYRAQPGVNRARGEVPLREVRGHCRIDLADRSVEKLGLGAARVQRIHIELQRLFRGGDLVARQTECGGRHDDIRLFPGSDHEVSLTIPFVLRKVIAASPPTTITERRANHRNHPTPGSCHAVAARASSFDNVSIKPSTTTNRISAASRRDALLLCRP